MPNQWQGSHSRGFPTATRRLILERDPICRCPGCKHCTTPGCTRPSTEADHIIPVADRGTHHPDNGRGMCKRCHLAATLTHATLARARTPRLARDSEPHPGVI